jgi:DNA-binding IclR family transcriptional regulator
VRLPESLFASRTMQALELLALHPLSAPQVAEALQVHPRTARRLLTRLAEDGWLARSQDARRVYAPTLRIVSLAGQVLARCRLAEAALPFVERLHAALGGPAHLMIPSYRWVLCVAHAEGRATIGPRELAPSHATAAGKALLAHRDEWRDDVLSGPLERLTPRTLTDPATLRDDAAAVRERGWATEVGEWRSGLRAVAAPVIDGGEAVAALAATVEGDLQEAGERVAASARELGERLRDA